MLASVAVMVLSRRIAESTILPEQYNEVGRYVPGSVQISALTATVLLPSSLCTTVVVPEATSLLLFAFMEV